MAPSPTTIPTSFVPKQQVRPGTRFSSSGGNTLLTISLVLLGIAILGCGAVFAYERYLLSISEAKAAEVAAEEARISASTVEDFIRTRDRFSAAKDLLDRHIAVSGFFNLLESITLQTVRFSSLTLTVVDDRSAEISMEGFARTFNALAAQSSAFASEKRVKRAIFSGITVNDNDTVTFTLAADLEPALLEFTAEGAPEAAPAPVDAEVPATEPADAAAPAAVPPAAGGTAPAGPMPTGPTTTP